MTTPSVYTAVREILTGNPKLTADEVIALAKSMGVMKSSDDIRGVVHRTRADLKERDAKKRLKGKAAPSPYTVARELLAAEPDLVPDRVVGLARAKGVTADEASIREAFRKVRGLLRHKAVPAPAAARTTAEPKPDPAPVVAEPDSLASVILANRTALLCGGVAKAREVAEAIRACGGIDAFLKRLDVVADILGSETSL